MAKHKLYVIYKLYGGEIYTRFISISLSICLSISISVSTYKLYGGRKAMAEGQTTCRHEK